MTPRRALVWCYDLEGAQVDAIGHGFLELYTDERLGQSEELHLELAADHPKADRLAADVELAYRARRYFVAEREELRQGTKSTISIEAHATWYRLGESTYVGSLVLSDASPVLGLETILEGTAWTADTGTTHPFGSFSLEEQDRSRLELLRAWAKVTGLWLRFDTGGRTVALTSTPGDAVGMTYRYRRNLTSARRRVRPPELTRLFPYGAQDLTIAGANAGVPYVEDLSYYTDQGVDLDAVRPDGLTNREYFTRSKVWSDSSFIREADLLAGAEVRLAELAGAQVTYELKVVDLSELTDVPERIEVGQTVRAYDPDFSVDLRTIVSRLRRYDLEPWRNQVELDSSPSPVSDGSRGARPQSSQSWQMFTGPIRATYQIRNDGSYFVAKCPLRFAEGGIANYHLDLFAVGVGAGNMVVTVLDIEAEPDEQQFKQLTVPYTDGATVRASLQWATEELEGSKNYKVRVTTVASGGPGGSKGVNIAADSTDPAESSFWIMAVGAVQETPTIPNSVTYDFTGAVQTFTVPDNVEEITITARGAQGGGGSGGAGAEVTASFEVVPGTVYDVYVGGQPATATGGWPNGGNGNGPFADQRGGGGSSDVRPTGAGLASALICAGAGGGRGEGSASNTNPFGGTGGYTNGGNAQHANGATQSAGGDGGGAGGAGTFGLGGDSTGGGFFDFGGGGGGGGWYGGEGGQTAGSPNQSGGGGGSSMIAGDGFDFEFADGARTGHGQVVISWEDPIE